MRPDATVIIPQYGQEHLTIAAVRSLRLTDETRWPVIVVDDGSCREVLERTRHGLGREILLTQPHCGISAAWNRGLDAASTPYVVLLNNDVRMEGPWVDRLLWPLREERAQLSGLEMRAERAVPESVLKRIGRCEFLAGWCFAVRREAALAIGGFDTAMRLYFSDTDFQARLLRVQGPQARVAVVRNLPLRHMGHRSTGFVSERRELWRSDRAHFVRKWGAGES